VPQFKQLFTFLSPQRPGLDPNPVYVGFRWTEWEWDRFFYELFGYLLSLLFYQCPILIFHPFITDALIVALDSVVK